MSEHATTPDTEESRTALKSVDQARRALVEATRGPVWLTALGTGMLAVVLLGGWLLDESGPKEAVTGLGTLAFFGLWGFYLSLLNRKGLKIRVIPPSSAGRWFMLGHVAFFILLFVLTGWLRKRGHSWAPWASTAIICATFAIQSHRFPHRGADRPSGSAMNKKGFDEVIHAPNRLQICAYLASMSEIEFQRLRDFLGVSDSVLSKHLTVLEEAGYLDPSKRASNGRQRTWIALSSEGRKAYLNHVRELKRIVG